MAWFKIAPYFFPETNWAGNSIPPSLGVSGDMFGGLTALFSGLAFAGLISTLLMQRKELELQRKELSQTREVFSIQRFEGTLFGVLKLLNDHVMNMTCVDPDHVSRIGRGDSMLLGREAMEAISQTLPSQLVDVGPFSENQFGQTISQGNMKERGVAETMAEYREIYEANLEVDLSPYFRILYNIFRLIEAQTFVANAKENDAMKRDYARIVRAHLSSSEVKILLFNCADPLNFKLKKLVVDYALLKHLPSNDREECSTICATYPPEAFGE